MKYWSLSLHAGLFLILFLSLLALFAPQLSSHDPNFIELQNRFSSPTFQQPMGADQNGRDIMSQVLFGASVSLTLAFAVVIVSVLIGLIVGCLSGYFGGWMDSFFMRLVDIVFAFPGFLLVLTLAAITQGGSLLHLVFIMALTGWAGYARLIRGEVLHLKHKEYILSSEALGANHQRKILVHLVPNLWPPILVHASFGMAMTIVTEASLSFLGVGVPPETPSWGSLLNSSRHFLLEAPYMSIFPGLALLLTVLAFNLLGEGLQDQFSAQTKYKRIHDEP